MKHTFDRDLFERAFSANIISCRRSCACGRVFWDGENSGYSWEDGEVEALEKDPNATRLPYAVSILSIEGREVVADCNCWLDRAKALTRILDLNGEQFTKWYNLRKKEAIAQAANMVEVKP